MIQGSKQFSGLDDVAKVLKEITVASVWLCVVVAFALLLLRLLKNVATGCRQIKIRLHTNLGIEQFTCNLGADLG